MKRLQNIQGLRAIAALLVIFVHVGGPTGFTAKNMAGQDPFWLLYPIGNAGVDLFFAISGLIMIVTTSRTEHSPPSAGRFLLRRIIRIYPPYIAITLALFVLRLFVPSPEGTASGLLPSLTLWPDFAMPILFVGWTLTYEVYFYLVFSISLFVPRRYQLWVLLAWGAVAVIGSLTFAEVSPVLGLIGGVLNLEFLLGVIVGTAVLRRQLYAPGLCLLGGLAGILVTYLVLLGPGSNVPNAWARVVGVGIPAAVILYGVVGLDSRKRRLPGWLNQFGDASYSLYLVHVPVLMVLALGARRLPPSAPVAVIAGICAIAIACITAVVFRRLVEQPLLRGLQRLTSRESNPRSVKPPSEEGPAISAAVRSQWPPGRSIGRR